MSDDSGEIWDDNPVLSPRAQRGASEPGQSPTLVTHTEQQARLADRRSRSVRCWAPMPQTCCWLRRFVAALAVVGVLLAPVEAVLHAQAVAPNAMPMASHAAEHTSSHNPPGHQAPHHGATPCCDLCFGGCSCATGPVAVVACSAVTPPLDGFTFVNALAPRLLPPRLAPHANAFALPPPAAGSA